MTKNKIDMEELKVKVVEVSQEKEQPQGDAMEAKLQKEIEVYHKKQKDSDIEPQTTEIVLLGVTK